MTVSAGGRIVTGLVSVAVCVGAVAIRTLRSVDVMVRGSVNIAVVGIPVVNVKPGAVVVSVSRSVLAGSVMGGSVAAVWVSCNVIVDAGIVVTLVRNTVEAS